MTGRSTSMYPVGLRWTTGAQARSRIVWWNPGWLCVGAAFLLSIIGVVAIATTRSESATRQVAILLIAITSAAAVSVPNYQWLRRFNVPLLAVVVLMLLFVLIPWVPEAIVRPRHGARRWINLGVTDFQPSELAKIAYIVSLAAYLRYRKNYRRLGGLLLPFVLTFIPLALVLVEPDLGTAMLFLPTLFTILIAAGAKLRHLVLIVVLGLAVAPMMYPMLRPHQKARIHALYYQIKGDRRHVQDIGFQGDKAMMLVGAGGLAGVGREHAADLIRYNHLPEEHNDMVFAVIACRWGALGVAGILGLFGVVGIGGLLVAARCRDPFGRLIVVGIVAVIIAQMTINIGMTIGLMPITGMTLPFISYGGSSLVATWLMIGLMLNVALRRPRSLRRNAFEFDGDDETE